MSGGSGLYGQGESVESENASRLEPGGVSKSGDAMPGKSRTVAALDFAHGIAQGKGGAKMADPVRLAVSLGKPVSRGLLPYSHAVAAIALAVAREEPDPTDGIRVASHILNINLRQIEDRRQAASAEIRRAVWPLMDGGERNGRKLLAIAHDNNGAHGFPLGEDEVTVLVRALGQACLRRAASGGNFPNRRRVGR